MRNVIRYLYLLLVIAGGLLLGWYLHTGQTTHIHTNATLAPVFQLAGRTTKTLDRLVTRATLIDKKDEQKFADVFIEKYPTSFAYLERKHSLDSIKKEEYLNALVQRIGNHVDLSFNYRVFLDYSLVPNAYALPGGIIFVTTELLNILHNEAQLISILAHEVAHVEMGHCADMIKFQVFFKKLQVEPIGRFLDFFKRFMLDHSFSKTQENEADEFAFELMKQSVYDPREQARAFSLLESDREGNDNTHGGVIRDYFATHPTTASRVHKFAEYAERWWRLNSTEKRYRGVKNLKALEPFDAFSHEEQEWVTQLSSPQK